MTSSFLLDTLHSKGETRYFLVLAGGVYFISENHVIRAWSERPALPVMVFPSHGYSNYLGI